jgi:hypothetical protein
VSATGAPMTDLNADVRLRPTRIGFLVRPTDMASIKKIMAYCCCLWGGAHNPIIPVFKSTPKDWRDERFERLKGPAIARGYINFFEPDVYVEAEERNPRSCVLRSVTRDKKECSPFRNCTLRCDFIMRESRYQQWR